MYVYEYGDSCRQTKKKKGEKGIVFFFFFCVVLQCSVWWSAARWQRKTKKQVAHLKL
jgi:hypothetical protein